MGLLKYSGHFIPNMSHCCILCCAWCWSQDCEKAFKLAKEKLISPSVLVHYDSSLPIPIQLAGNVSVYRVGAVISHVMADGRERPISFASRTLLPSECNYALVEKGALSLIFGINKFILTFMDGILY